MRFNSHRLILPVATVGVVLLIPAAQATGAITPTPHRVTGIVQTIIREQPPGHRTSANDIPGNDAPSNDTTKVLRVGTTIVPLTEGALPTTKDGTRVSVTVLPDAGGTSRVLSASTIAAPQEAALPAAHQVYVAVVQPVGLSADPSITAASAQAMVSKVSQYWSSQTGGQVTFVTAQVLKYRSAYSCDGTNAGTYKMWSEGLRLMPHASGPGRHLVVVAPGGADSAGCSYGLGSIGAVMASGNEVFVSGLDQSLLAHELGHNLGLYHANSLRCTNTQDMAIVSLAFPSCQTNPYDDLFDVMGYSGVGYGEGNLNAVHLNGMNLLPAAVRKISASSGVTTARIAPLSTTTAGRTLKITDASGAIYFVEYRTDSGRDTVARSNPWHPAWGVRVLRGDPQAPPSAGSYELDATPTGLTYYDYNRSIPVGGTFRAASKKLTITVAAQDPSGATLTISDWATPIIPSKVTITVPAKARVGDTITPATRVTDQYGRPVPYQGVTLQKMQTGESVWRSVRSVLTTSTGAASYAFANGVSGHYRWLTPAATGAPSRVSPAAAVLSTARVTGKAPAKTMTHGGYLSLAGSVSAVPAPVVYIQYRYGAGPWHNGPRVTVKGTAVGGRIALTVRGTAYTRLYVAAATSYAPSSSTSYATAVR